MLNVVFIAFDANFIFLGSVVDIRDVGCFAKCGLDFNIDFNVAQQLAEDARNHAIFEE